MQRMYCIRTCRVVAKNQGHAESPSSVIALAAEDYQTPSSVHLHRSVNHPSDKIFAELVLSQFGCTSGMIFAITKSHQIW